jgi:cobaltochelatase CobN
MLTSRIKIALISTKTTLRALFEAVEAVEREAGIDLDLDVVYHMCDSERLDFAEAASRVLRADVILIDSRGAGLPKQLDEAVNNSTAKLVVPLVGGGTSLAYLRLGNLSGEAFARRARPLDFDADRIDMKRAFKVINFVERVSRALPLGVLRDYKNYIWITKYWTFWGKRNLENLLKLILSEYFEVKVKFEEPRREVDSCLYIPEKGCCVDEVVVPKRPAVAIFLYGGMHFEQNLPVALALKGELEKLGISSLFVVGGSAESVLTQVDTLKKFTVVKGEPVVDAVVNLQLFTINGGPYGGDVEPTRRLFSSAGYLLFNGLIAYQKRYSDWRSDPRGLSPIEVLMGVALPEIDGAIEPIISATVDDTQNTDIVVLEERVRKKAARIAKWIQLRRKPNNSKRVAVIIYNYPPGEENVGAAAYLDVFESLAVLLRALADAGYYVEPKSKDDLLGLVKDLLVNSPKWRLYRERSQALLERVPQLLQLPTRSAQERRRGDVGSAAGRRERRRRRQLRGARRSAGQRFHRRATR